MLRESLPLGESVKREAWVALSVRHRATSCRGHGRVLLAGEAGGFMSPTSGEGISYALNTGRLGGSGGRGRNSPLERPRRLRSGMPPHRVEHRAQAEVAPVHGVAAGQVPGRLRPDAARVAE